MAVPTPAFSSTDFDDGNWTNISFPPLSDDQHDTNTGLTLDGVDDGTRADPVLLENDTAQTFAMWIRTTSVSLQSILMLQTDNTDVSGIRMSILSGGGIRLRAEGSGGANATVSDSSTSYNDGLWHLIVGVRSGTGTSTSCRIYSEAGEASYAVQDQDFGTGSTAIGSNAAAQDLQVGLRFSDNAAPFDGEASRVRVWRVALSSSEVSEYINEELASSIYNDTLHQWRVDETTGPYADTGSDGTATGTQLGNPLASSSVPPTQFINPLCRIFDGVDDAIDIGDIATVSGLTEFSVAAWVNTARVSLNQSILGKTSGSGNREFDLLVTSTGELKFKVTTAVENTAITGTTVLTEGAWYHVCGVFDGAFMHLYRNGSLEGSAARTADNGNTSNSVRIGQESNGDSSFDGRLDDLRFYDRALTTAQVLALAQGLGTDGDPGEGVDGEFRIVGPIVGRIVSRIVDPIA